MPARPRKCRRSPALAQQQLGHQTWSSAALVIGADCWAIRAASLASFCRANNPVAGIRPPSGQRSRCEGLVRVRDEHQQFRFGAAVASAPRRVRAVAASTSSMSSAADLTSSFMILPRFGSSTFSGSPLKACASERASICTLSIYPLRSARRQGSLFGYRIKFAVRISTASRRSCRANPRVCPKLLSLSADPRACFKCIAGSQGAQNKN